MMNKLTNEERMLWSTLARISELISKHGEMLFRNTNLTITQYGTLQTIDYLLGDTKTHIKITDLVPYLNRRLPSVSLIIDRMEKKKLVKRVKDPSDRRVVGIKILARGRKLLAETENPTIEYAKKILSALSGKELKEAIILMNKILKVVEEETSLKEKKATSHNITIEQRIELEKRLS